MRALRVITLGPCLRRGTGSNDENRTNPPRLHRAPPLWLGE